MFKLNDKKHRKRALMKLQCVDGYKPKNDEPKDDFYSVSNGQKTTNRTIEIQYNMDETPNHLVRKTMKFEEVRCQNNNSGLDEVDRAGSSQMMKNFTSNFSSFQRNSSVQSKVLNTNPPLRC